MPDVSAQAVIDRLLREIARLSYELAVAQEVAVTAGTPPQATTEPAAAAASEQAAQRPVGRE